MKRYIILAAVFCLALFSCKGPSTPSDQEIFLQKESMCLMVGYKEMIDFSAGELQFSYNDTKHIYRAGVTVSQPDQNSGATVQTVQNYYVLRLEAAPGDEGSEVRGVLTLCSPTISSGIRTYDLKNATVLKTDASQVWIWDPELHLGVIVRY